MLCPLGFLIFPTLCLSAVSGGRRLSAPLRTPPQAGEWSPCRQASPGPRLGSALIPGQTQLRDRRAAYDRRRPPASFTADRTKAQRGDVIFTKSHGKWEAEKQDPALLAATVSLFLKVPQSLPTQRQSSSELWKLELRGYASRQLRVKAHHIRLGRRGQAEAGVPDHLGREEPRPLCLQSGEEAAGHASCHWTGQDLDTAFYRGQGQRSPENTEGGARREPWTGDQADPASGPAPPARARAPHSTALIPIRRPTLSSSGSRSALLEIAALDTKPRVQQPERPWDPAGQLCPGERPTGTRCSEPREGPRRSLQRASASARECPRSRRRDGGRPLLPAAPPPRPPDGRPLKVGVGTSCQECTLNTRLWKEASGPWFCGSRRVEPRTISAACPHGPGTGTGPPVFWGAGGVVGKSARLLRTSCVPSDKLLSLSEPESPNRPRVPGGLTGRSAADCPPAPWGTTATSLGHPGT